MPYLKSAEALASLLTGICWGLVWSRPTIERIRQAALSSALLVVLRAFSLSMMIVLNAR